MFVFYKSRKRKSIDLVTQIKTGLIIYVNGV